MLSDKHILASLRNNPSMIGLLQAKAWLVASKD
jgi:hypothetical protein